MTTKTIIENILNGKPIRRAISEATKKPEVVLLSHNHKDSIRVLINGFEYNFVVNDFITNKPEKVFNSVKALIAKGHTGRAVQYLKKVATTTDSYKDSDTPLSQTQLDTYIKYVAAKFNDLNYSINRSQPQLRYPYTSFAHSEGEIENTYIDTLIHNLTKRLKPYHFIYKNKTRDDLIFIYDNTQTVKEIRKQFPDLKI